MKQKRTIFTVCLLATIVSAPLTTQVAFAEPTIKFDQDAKQQGQQKGQLQRDSSRQKNSKDSKKRDQNDQNQLGSKGHPPT